MKLKETNGRRNVSLVNSFKTAVRWSDNNKTLKQVAHVTCGWTMFIHDLMSIVRWSSFPSRVEHVCVGVVTTVYRVSGL